VSVDRYDFQQLAVLRLEDANVLLRENRFAAAYYFGGYAAECGLKACVARLTKRFEFPDRQRLRDIYTHDLAQLLRMANLEAVRDLEALRDEEFDGNWSVVRKWNEHSRYSASIDERTATELMHALSDRRHGVLRWIKRHW
jgi:HEPN domain-containing protein